MAYPDKMSFGNVLVTGGAGFLGSQLVQRLLPISSHLYVIDDLSVGKKAAIPVSKHLTFYQDSITNEKLLEKVLPKVEWIFHLCCRNIILSAEDLKSDFETNLYGGFLLLRKVKECCPNLKKMIYTSTASIYGNAPMLPTPENHYQITLPYAASKFSMEHYCQVFSSMYKLPITILRLSNVYGPGQVTSNPYCGVVAKFFEAIKTGEPISIYGDGTQTRDFTFLEDAMDAILTTSLDPKTNGNIYNVGTGIETSINMLAELMLKITDQPKFLVQYLEKRKVDSIYRRAVDASALQKEGNCRIRYSLKDGLKETHRWLQNAEKEKSKPRLKLLFITRSFENDLVQGVNYFIAELANQTDLMLWHDPGDIRDIIKKCKVKPDFIILHEHGLYGPNITGISNVDIPCGAYLHDLNQIMNNNTNTIKAAIDRDSIQYIFTIIRNKFIKWYPEYVDRMRWLPHCIDPAIFRDYDLQKDIDYLMIGNIIQKYYPLRYQIYQTMKERKNFVSHLHTGPYNIANKKDTALIGTKYAKEINRAKIFFTCSSNNKYPLQKYYEVLACNTLLLAPASQELKDLGFIPGVHFVDINESNFEQKAEYYLRNKAERKKITKEGYRLVHEKHTTAIRVAQFVEMIQQILDTKK